MFGVVPNGPILVLPSLIRSLDMAVGLRLSDRALDERGLGLPTKCNRHLERNDGRRVVALQRHLDSAVASNLELLN